MARFKYLGEPKDKFPYVSSSKLLKIVLRRKDGSKQTLDPIAPATEFPVGQDIGYEITDERSVYQLRADTRYEEIV